MEKKVIIGLVVLILLGATIQLFAAPPINANAQSVFRTNPDVSFKIYPNPATTHVTFSLQDHTQIIHELKIFNAVGELKYSRKLSPYDVLDEVEIDISSLQKGVYFIQILGQNIQLTRKLIIRE